MKHLKLYVIHWKWESSSGMLPAYHFCTLILESNDFNQKSILGIVVVLNGVVATQNIFWFSPRKLGKIPILTNIFQIGWNHQQVNVIIAFKCHVFLKVLWVKLVEIPMRWSPVTKISMEWNRWNLLPCCSPRNLWKRCAKIAVQQRYACHTGNMGLAKLCYRRGAVLSAKTQKGETAFNIVTQNKRYDALPQPDRPIKDIKGPKKRVFLAQAPPKQRGEFRAFGECWCTRIPLLNVYTWRVDKVWAK